MYAICKNEAKFVDRFMDSMSEADDICVLDTGSEDDSVDRLRRRGAVTEQAFIEPWRFDAARNESMRLIPPDAEICCCIDLDESFRPGWRSALERAWEQGADQVLYRYTWSFEPDGREGVVFFADKIHRNGCFRWVGAVHETLYSTGSGDCRRVIAQDVQLDHRPDPKKSRGQYLPLLELAVTEAPEDDRSCHYLGREYMFHGEWEKAIRVLERHLSMKSAVWAEERCASMRFLARCLRKLGREGEAEQWLRRACAEAPRLREPYLEYADLLYAQQRWHGVIALCECALAIRERPYSYISESFAWGSFPYDLLSVACYHTDALSDALRYCEQAAALAPTEQRILDNLKLLRLELKSN